MAKFINPENLAPFKARLTDAPEESDRQVLLRLLGQQDAQDSPRPPRSRS
jgi:hypothetical protein